MSLTADLARALALLLTMWIVVAAARWLREYRRFRRMELALDGPPSLPLFGNAFSFLGIAHHNILAVLMGLWGGRLHDISRATIFNRMLVFVTHPDDIGRVITDPRKRFNDKPWFFYGVLRDVVGNGSTVASGASWRAHRAVTQPTFNVKILDGYVEYFSEETKEFVRQIQETLRKGKCADGVYVFDAVHDAVARGTLRATMASSFHPGDHDRMDFLVSGMAKALVTVARRTYNVLLWPSTIFRMTPSAKFLRDYCRAADQYAIAVIDRKEKAFKEDMAAAGGRMPQRRKVGTERKSFLDHVVEAKLHNKANLPDQEIIDEVKTVFSAAVETSTDTICFALKVLSIKPDVQDRCYQELFEVFGDSDRPVTAKDLLSKMIHIKAIHGGLADGCGLVYLERVVKETLRLFPTIPLTARAVHEDSDLNGKMIPAGSILVLNLFSTHRHPDFHKDPLEFDPDRFERGRSAGRHPFCYLPFSAGPRNCVGQRSGMLQVKTALANTLRAFRVDPVDDGVKEVSQFPLTTDLALRYVGGVKVKLVPRPSPVAG